MIFDTRLLFRFRNWLDVTLQAVRYFHTHRVDSLAQKNRASNRVSVLQSATLRFDPLQMFRARAEPEDSVQVAACRLDVGPSRPPPAPPPPAPSHAPQRLLPGGAI